MLFASTVVVERFFSSLNRLATVALFLSGLSFGCIGQRVDEKLNTDAGTPQGATASGKAANSLAPTGLAKLIIAKLKANLKAKSELSDAQIDQIGDSAEKKVVATRPAAGLAEVDAGQVSDFIDDLAEGALAAIGDPSFSELEQPKVLNLLKVIVQSTLQSLKGQTNGLNEAAQKAMLTEIMKKIVGALDDAGFDYSEIGEGARVSLTTAVNGLNEAGILTDTNASAMIGALIKGAVLGSQKPAAATLTGVRGAMFLADDEDNADEDSGVGVDSGEESAADEDKDSDGDGVADSDESTESEDPEDVEVGDLPPSEEFADLDQFNPASPLGSEASDEQVAASLYYSILYGAVGALDEAGFDNAEIIALAPALIRGLLESMGGAGVPQKAVERYLTFAVQGTLSGLSESITQEDELLTSVAAVVRGATEAIHSLGFTLSQSQNLIGIVVKASISHLPDLKAIAKAKYPDAVRKVISQGTSALSVIGVSKAKADGLVSSIKTIISAALAELEDIGLSDDEIIAAVTVATGASFAALDDLGFQASDLLAIEEALIGELKVALVKIDSDLFGDLDYSALDYDAE